MSSPSTPTATTATQGIRYGAKPVEARRNRELEATRSEIWSDSLEAVYETDAELIAAVLPPPLEPGPEPRVRLNITQVTMPGNYVFGAGWFGVQARHGDVLGEYALFMPMSTEQATVGGRETFGEPKKIAQFTSSRTGGEGDTGRGLGAEVSAAISRMGFTVAEIHGRVTGEREPTEHHRIDFYFKLSPSPEDPGALDADPLIVHSHKHLTERTAAGVEGEVVLGDSPVDPVGDLPVRRLIDIALTERTSVVDAKVIGTVPRDDLLPYIHQRYDDLSVLGKKD